MEGGIESQHRAEIVTQTTVFLCCIYAGSQQLYKNIDVTAKMAAQKAEWGLPFPQKKKIPNIRLFSADGVYLCITFLIFL